MRSHLLKFFIALIISVSVTSAYAVYNEREKLTIRHPLDEADSQIYSEIVQEVNNGQKNIGDKNLCMTPCSDWDCDNFSYFVCDNWEATGNAIDTFGTIHGGFLLIGIIIQSFILLALCCVSHLFENKIVLSTPASS